MSAQQITFFYANDLAAGAHFLGNVLGLAEVPSLVQRDKCRIFHTSRAGAGYLGVCDTRRAPSCAPSGSSGNAVPATFTLVLPGRADVDDYRTTLLPLEEAGLLNLTAAGGSAVWGAYGFDFFDTDTAHGLGCYRFEVQSFDDPAWPASADNATLPLRNQLRRAGTEFQNASAPTPVACPCADFCSGRCFAAGCRVCVAATWNDDAGSCVDAGPLGQGLLCAPHAPDAPCCQPNGTACAIEGGQWCDCSQFPKQPPLFPPLTSRVWSKAGGCKEEHEEERSGTV